MEKNTTENCCPYWFPPHTPLESLPENLQAAISGIVGPAYESLVVAAKPGLEQSMGLTITHLLYLEILDQLQLHGVPNAAEERMQQIDKLLKLAGTKIKASALLVKIQKLRLQREAEFGPLDSFMQP